jgi:hypothetical protein
MADPKLLKLLSEGVPTWNNWLVENLQTRQELKLGLDLSDADLHGFNLDAVDLFQADLSRANLDEAHLNGAHLDGAILKEARLRRAVLSGACLSTANLIGADFSGADLNDANLNSADLTGARLIDANLIRADLTGANFSDADLTRAQLVGATMRVPILQKTNFFQALFGSTELVNTNLSEAVGLESAWHVGPSSIGIDTFFRSKGKIPEAFLRGAGVPDVFIEYASSLVARPIEFYSVFISYSSKDDAFAQRLHADLQAKGVRCWFAPEDLKTGDKFRPEIDRAIRLHDKLLLLLSKHSVSSDWVEKEVETAFEGERRDNRTVLFPIRLDGAVMEIQDGWPADIRRTRHLGDFTKWKDHYSYQKAFERLLRDLKADKPVNVTKVAN